MEETRGLPEGLKDYGKGVAGALWEELVLFNGRVFSGSRAGGSLSNHRSRGTFFAYSVRGNFGK